MIDVSKLQHTWHGEYDTNHLYVRGDIVRFKNASYVCIRDLPTEYVTAGPTAYNTELYGYQVLPGVYLKTKDPTDTKYWLRFTPNNSFVGNWRRNWMYEIGEIVNLAGDLYICTKEAGGIRNLYPPINTDYFTKIFESADEDNRQIPVSTAFQQPLGWKYNMGECFHGTMAATRGMNFIDSDGLFYSGGNAMSGYHGRGTSENGAHRLSAQPTGFTYVDWFNSTDNGGTGRMTTPHGKAPKVIQYETGCAQIGLWLLDNGEVYSAGTNSWGQLGVGDETDRHFTVRVSSTDTTDWLGNTLPYDFNNTKIKKIALTGANAGAGTNSCFALDEFGGVWAWGNNNYGALGLGAKTVTNTTAAASLYNNTSENHRPRRIPQSFFGDKKIVDIYAFGGTSAYGRALAIDEDGRLWAWGQETNGELGLGTRVGTGVPEYGYHPVPQMIPIDFNMYGGIKKIMHCGSSAQYHRLALLDGEGKLWLTGWFYASANSSNPVAQSSSSGYSVENNENEVINGRIGTWMRLEKGFWRDHDAENFWMFGGDNYYNIYVREKGTGITYSMGVNNYGQLGNNSNTTTGTVTYLEPARVEGPTNVVQMMCTNTYTHESYITVLAVCEDGSAWGAGYNGYGSLGTFSSGQGYYEASRNYYTTGGFHFQLNPHSVSPGTRITHVSGWGHSSYDACTWFTESNDVMVSGADGNGDGGYQIWQGSGWPDKYYQDSSPKSNPGNYHRYHVHSYPMAC